MASVGYEFLRQSMDIAALPLVRPARITAVTRVLREDHQIGVPAPVAPASAEPLQHVLFALKHEGTNLQILSQALPRIPGAALLAELRRSPNGAYIRTVCYLWEHFAEQQLDDLPPIGGAATEVFDPALYFTGPARRNTRWRVDFNGLGSLKYCATIERTPALVAALERNILQRAADFVAQLDRTLVGRALEWAYLHETRDSFAIENEAPTEDKARRFVALLHQAHDGTRLSEEYLVQLQNATVSNPLDQASAFRHEQNWLEGPGRGTLAVTYLPPPAGLAQELVDELMSFVNDHSAGVAPLLLASIASFGFVFVHPFMDGNGRLSRFLFHKALCLSGQLQQGLILPVSVAMHRHEADYLDALTAYSRPVRDFWNVDWIGQDRYRFEFTGHDALYRFWDATRCTEFGCRMAEQALETELRQETEFLSNYDAIMRKVNERFDVRGNVLSQLVVNCLDNQGIVSRNRRKQLAGVVPDEVFDYIEAIAGERLGGRAGDAA
jgi:Fic family protein